MSAKNSRPSSRSSGIAANSQSPSSSPRANSQLSNTPRNLDRDVQEMMRIESQYELNGKSLQDLRLMKKNAIENYKYDDSEAIQKYIDLQNKDNSAKVISAFQDWLRDGILDAIGNFESNKVEIEQETEDKELHIREDTHTVFEDMKKRHLDEITSVETERRIDQLHEENRESAEVRDLRKQSQKLATNDDVAGAKAVKARADELKQSNEEEGKKQVNAKYDKLLDKLKQKQTLELNLLQTRLEDLLAENQKICGEEIKTQQKMVTVYIHYSLQKAITEGSKQLLKKESFSNVSSSLKKFVKDLLKEQGKEYFLDGSE